MTDMKQHTRRPPQPPIDPARVVSGARFQKNRAEDIGKPATFVIVDAVEYVEGQAATYHIVHYHNEATLRRGKMPLKDFCAGSEHREPDPVIEEAPTSGTREAEPDVDLRAVNAKLDEILAILKRPGQLSLAVPR